MKTIIAFITILALSACSITPTATEPASKEYDMKRKALAYSCPSNNYCGANPYPTNTYNPATR